MQEFDVYNGAIQPGSHTLSVALLYQGNGFGVFSYLKGYKFNVKSSHTFVAGESKSTNITVVGYEKGNITTQLSDKPAIDFRVNVAVGRRERHDGGGAEEVTDLMAKGQPVAAAFASLRVGLVGSAARADEVDDYLKKLIDLDQRVHLMTLELKEAPPPPPDIADRRVLDAQVLYSLKNYEEAATILLDVVEKYPNSRAHDDALALLGESLFQARDYYTARHYLQEAVAKNTGSKHRAAGAAAAGRAIAEDRRLRPHRSATSTRLQNLPPQLMEPATPYVRGKYFYYRNRLDEAAQVFAAIPQANPYFFQARYFIATIQVKRGDLAGRDAGLRRAAEAAGARRRRAKTSRTWPGWRSRASSTSDRSSTKRSRRTWRSRGSRSTGPRRCASRPGRTSRPRTGSARTAR